MVPTQTEPNHVSLHANLRPSAPNGELRLRCPSCRQKLSIARRGQLAGKQITCPACETSFRIDPGSRWNSDTPQVESESRRESTSTIAVPSPNLTAVAHDSDSEMLTAVRMNDLPPPPRRDHVWIVSGVLGVTAIVCITCLVINLNRAPQVVPVPVVHDSLEVDAARSLERDTVQLQHELDANRAALQKLVAANEALEVKCREEAAEVQNLRSVVEKVLEPSAR